MKLDDYIEPPYQEHKRTVDTYGYVTFDGNYYWVPEKVKGKLTVIEYELRISGVELKKQTIHSGRGSSAFTGAAK